MMAVVLLTAVLSMQFERFVRQYQSPQRIENSIAELIDFRDNMVELLESGNIDELRDLFIQHPRFRRQFLIFDTWDNELFDREQLLLPTLQKRFNYGLGKEFKQRGLAFSTPVISDYGQAFYIEIQPNILFNPLFSPRFAGTLVRTALLVLLSAVVCYFLTRTLTRRIRHLQQATHHLSAENYRQALPVDMRFSKDELGQLGRDFQAMAERLDTANHARKQMLSDISHELRSPLARMQVALEITRERFPETEGQIARVEKESQRMSELIAQIIEMQKLALAEAQHTTSVDLVAVLQAVIADARYEYQHSQKSLELTIDTTEKSSNTAFEHGVVQQAMTRGVDTQLHSAFENLVRNALSHTAENSTVTLRLSRETTHWRIEISDYGNGVATADLDAIFQPFVRLDSSRNRQTGGYGLGLSIAKAIIESHRGSITAENRHTVSGLCVTVFLPHS